jgi:hypothetical protein
MKRALLITVIVVAGLLTWYGESRHFYCLDNGKCITVWKTYNNVCYIMPGKYYGIIKPSDNYIQTTNTNNLTIFFTAEMPNLLVIQSEDALEINNKNKKNYLLLDYSKATSRFDSIFYKRNAQKFNEIKDNARLIDLDIHENYAIDKDGRHL